MKLIGKALHNKKGFQYGILILILVLTVLSIQMSATVTLKNKTMIQKVNEIQAAHTNIYVEDAVAVDNPESDDDIHAYVNTINELNNIELVDAIEDSYYAVLTPYNIKEVNQQTYLGDTQKLRLEGYVSHSGTNQYRMVEGKSYKQLKDNEIVINEACANARKKKNQAVIGGSYYSQDGYQYKIVGVYEDPAYYEDATAILQDTTLFKTNVQRIKYHALGNYQTVKKQASFIQEETYTNDNGEQVTVPYQITQVVHKIHLQDYSIENESTLLTLIQINSYGANYADFQPLYYQLQGDNTTQSIFKYLSYTLLAALIIGDFFVFYAFFKRKLDEDKNKLAMMILCGIKQKNIMKAYIRELSVQVCCTLLICGGLNALGYYVFQLHKQAYTAIFFDMTPVLLGITGLAVLLIFSLLSLMIIIQIKVFFTKNLNRVMKEKDLTIKKASRIHIGYRGQIFQMGLRDLMSNKFKFARVVFASTFLILCMLLTYCSYQTLGQLYNTDTIGLSFDYTIGNVSKAQYQHMKEKYIKEVSILTTQTQYFLEKTGELDGLDINKYYDATLITLYDNVAPFILKRSGVYPKPGVDIGPDGSLIYYEREALLPRKLMDVKDGIADENQKVEVNQKALGFSRAPYTNRWYMRDGFMYIKGTSDSLINNGYVAFTAMTAGKQKPVDQLVTSNTGANMGNGTVIKLQEGVKHQAFETYIKQERISFTSFDELIKQMEISNRQVNKNTFAVMIVVLAIMFLMFMVLTFANIAEEAMHKREEQSFMKKTGWTSAFIKRLNLTKNILLFMSSGIAAIVLFYPMKWVYFYFLFKVLGVYTLATQGLLLLGCLGCILLGLVIYLFYLNRKTKKIV